MSEARHGFEWTSTTLNRLRTLWGEGHPTAEIGRRMGISKNAVVGKAHHLALPARPSPIRTADPSAPKRTPSRRPVPKLADIMPLKSMLPVAAVVRHPTPAPSAPARAMTAMSTDGPQSRVKTERTHCCCWPIGDPGTPAFRFCEADAPPGKPYCPEHASIAYAKAHHQPSAADPTLQRRGEKASKAPIRSPKGG